jgi:hypothetical protein
MAKYYFFHNIVGLKQVNWRTRTQNHSAYPQGCARLNYTTSMLFFIPFFVSEVFWLSETDGIAIPA